MEEMLGHVHVCARTACYRIHSIRVKLYCGISTYQYEHTQRERGKWKGTTQRPTNLKRGRSERVSWGEAEEKSTVTVNLLRRRDKVQQL